MKEQPRPIQESIFANGSGIFTLVNGMVIGAITLFAFIAGLAIYTGAESIFTIEFAHIPKNALIHAQTMAFITLSVSQLFHALNLRHNQKSLFQVGFLSNKFLLVSILFGIGIQVGLVNIPLFNNIFGIHVLTLKDGLLILTLSLLPVIFNELWKAGKRIFLAP